MATSIDTERMLVTKDFVMINFPKTGSTFARKALMRLHAPSGIQGLLERTGLRQPSIQEFLMKQRFFTEVHAASNPIVEQHGAVSQIQEKFRAKPLMSVVRDPFERLVSLYEFRNWVDRPFPDRERLVQRYPHFPDLSFEEFLDMMRAFAPLTQPEGMHTQVGMLTTQFIRFFARDPLRTMLALRDDTDLVRDYDLHFPKITFLHTEGLSRELYDHLLDLGYEETRIAFILDMEKVNTTERSRPSYLTPEHMATIHQDERLLFQLFPEYLGKEAR